MNRTVAIAAVSVAVFACAAGGYALGAAGAPTEDDAASARVDGRAEAFEESLTSTRDAAHARGLQAGEKAGSQAGELAGTDSGDADGSTSANADLAAAEAAEIAASTPPLTTLPDGQPGYTLPESQRTLGCVGINASTSQCVGD